MGRSRAVAFVLWCRRAGLLAMMAAGFCCATARAGTWTWTGLGSDDNWSTTNNWRPAGVPSDLYTTTLVFDGNKRLMPEQDIGDSFQFGSLIFATNAGAFCLTGTTNIFGHSAWRNLQFAGSNPSLTLCGGSTVAIMGALITRVDPTNDTIAIASGMTLQLPWIIGGQSRVVVKKGGGTLRVCEHADGQYYFARSSTRGPEYVVEDGMVEMGTRTDRWVLASDYGSWRAAPSEVKVSYNLTVGDGIGDATSAVFRLIGPAQAEVLDNLLVITVNADGLLDFNGVQDWCRDSEDSLRLSVSNGLVRMGGNSLYVHSGRTLDLRGGARIEGSGDSALRLYDGATNRVDGLSSCAVLAASAALISADNGAGVVFHVSGRTGDVVALDVTGHLGAGGAGSHLVKRGAGTMAISNLTHAVRTNRVEEGTLLLNGVSRCAVPASAAQWAVLPHATLGGVGVISNAAVVVQGGTIDPGDAAVGCLTIDSNLVLSAGSMLRFDLACGSSGSGGTNDQLVIRRGVVTGLSNAVLRIEVPSPMDVDGQCFRIISGGGNLAGQSFGEVSLIGCRGRRADAVIGNGYVDVTIRNPDAGTGLIVR